MFHISRSSLEEAAARLDALPDGGSEADLDAEVAAFRPVTIVPEWRRRALARELPAVDATSRITDTSIVL